MADDNKSKVPASRIGRFGRVTRLAGSLAGGMAAEGIRQVRQGKRPKLQHMLLTPANAQRLTTELAKMRGAAMKMGQILSMDAGDMIPPELADILARLRSDAHTMPMKQLKQVLLESYGEDWRERFGSFDYKPVAAASIGQVHKARSLDGEWLALKIQYPGIRQSIDSDVDNLGGLIKVTGLLPKEFKLKPLLAEIKLQLHDEANYELEAEYLANFGDILADDDRFVVPKLHPEHSNDTILAMDYIDAVPIEELANAWPVVRDKAVSSLFELMLRELFDLHLMQTDPNFANYQYEEDTGRIVLLDFGATRRFDSEFSQGYIQLIKAMLEDDDQKILATAKAIGYNHSQSSLGYQKILLSLFKIIGEIFSSDTPYDFNNSDIVDRMNEINLDMQEYKDEWTTPPIDALFFHRKLGGLFLLASRLDAKVAIRPLLEPYL
ncbi:MAG: AarF/ABC1/UbiB kinase family protein [Pseudomonadales bacterium]